MVMGVRACSNVFALSSPCCQFMFDTTDTCLAPFNTSHLLNEISAVRSNVPCFGAAMLKFTLNVSVSQVKFYKSP
jgi:hypothetical protein